MPQRNRLVCALAGALLLLAAPARADRVPPTAELHPVLPRGAVRPGGDGSTSSSGGWWLGTAGVAVGLAAFGAVSLAARRRPAPEGASRLRVAGRLALSPRHSVYLVQAGDRTLLIGAGPQGAPALLGEWAEPARRAEGEA